MNVIEDAKTSCYSGYAASDAPPVAANHLLVLAQGESSLDLSEIPDTRDCTATFTQNAGHALQVLRELRPGVALLDVGRGTASDLSLIEEAAKQGASVVVIGHDERGLFAQQARSRGARAYLEHPVRAEDIRQILSAAADHAESTQAGATTKNTVRQNRGSAEIGDPEISAWELVLSDSPTMRSVAEQVRRVAPTNAAVLVTGESGTGKEVVARAIHEQSDRKDKPFLPINCGAISPQLIESELFGHDKGSFTGAVKEHQGVFERAHGGTLFLDEITEMPLELQVKLLRVLETHEFVRVGSSRAQQADVRVICASNRTPEQEVEAGNLRADLLYRIQVFPIKLPPLRARDGDIPLLTDRFLEELNIETARSTRLTPEALRVLEGYHWPGNLRELRNVIQRAHIMADDWIRAEDLPDDIRNPVREGHERGPSLTVNIGTSVAEMEKNLILATLEQCEGRKDRAAQVLGVSLKTLYNRLRDYEREDA